MVGLPYKNEELGMYILLPKRDNPYKYNIKEFVQNLQTSEMLETMSKATRRDVVMRLPKMSLTHSFSILDQLKKYREFKTETYLKQKKGKDLNVADKIKKKVEAFNNFTGDDTGDVYLTNASTDGPLRIDDIVQQIVLSVNEKGTEAAAVTATTIDYIGGSKNFLVERPFAFFIRHEATSATLFWGTVSNPSQD